MSTNNASDEDREFSEFAKRVRAAYLTPGNEAWNEVSKEFGRRNMCARPRSSNGCPDSCCDIDEISLEQHPDARAAYFAKLFGDEAFKPLRRARIATAEEAERVEAIEQEGGE